jgi:hypothetical protein
MKKNHMIIDNVNKEYFVVCSEDGKVVVHVGYYEAKLTNDQVDDLITALKQVKKNK